MSLIVVSSTVVEILSELVLQAGDLEIVIADVFYPLVY